MRYGLPALAIEGALLGLISLHHPFQQLTVFLLLAFTAFIAYIVSLCFAWHDKDAGHGAVLLLLVAAVIFRITLLSFPHGGDMNRYLWEGRLQIHGINPFTFAPQDPEVTHLRDSIWDGINGKPYASIYPPLSQFVFLACTAMGGGFTLFKAVFSVFDLLTGVFLLLIVRQQGAPSLRALAYLWCPQVIFSIAARGHLDSIQTFFVVLAIYLFRKEEVKWSAFTLGLAIMSKSLAALLLPVFWLHAQRKRDLWPAALPLLFYLPYAGAGYGLIDSLIFMGVGAHDTDPGVGGFPWITNASLYPLLTGFQRIPYLVYVVAAICYFIVVLRARSVEDGCFAAWACFLVFTPTFHPWYFVAIAPFLALRWQPDWLALSGLLFLYFSFWTSGDWRPIAWIPLLEYIPFYFLMLLTWKMKYRGSAFMK